jgi:hypothetical protein
MRRSCDCACEGAPLSVLGRQEKIAARVQAARDEGAGLYVLLSIMALVMM